MNKVILRQTKISKQMLKDFAAGDVKGSSPIGALAAAYNGVISATSIVHEWYD